jgi:hypothetical protein
MVATSPAATSAEAPAVQGTSPVGVHAGDDVAPASVRESLPSPLEAPRLQGAERQGERASPDVDASFPAFVALIQSGPRRASSRAADPASPATASRVGSKSTRRSLGRPSLHPAWLDAIPASIDDLQGAPAPIETELETAVREVVILGARHKAPRFALPRGHWPWWAWATYASTIGAATFAGLYVSAVARLALPARQPLWVHRTRRGAASFLMTSTALMFATTAAFAIVPPIGRIATAIDGTTLQAPPPLAATIDADLAMANDGEATVSNSSGPTDSAGAAATAADTVTPLAMTSIDAAAVSITISPPLPDGAPDIDTPVAQAVMPTPVEAPAAPAPAAPKAPPVPTNRAVVANTGGRGVAFRNTASWDDRVTPKVAVRDGTALTIIESGITGDDGAGGSTAWVRVRDGSGRNGYVPARFVQAP